MKNRVWGKKLKKKNVLECFPKKHFWVRPNNKPLPLRENMELSLLRRGGGGKSFDKFGKINDIYKDPWETEIMIFEKLIIV